MSFFKKLKATLDVINESKLSSKDQQVNIKIEREETKKNLKKVMKYLKPAIVSIIIYVIIEALHVGINVFFPLKEASLFNCVTLLDFTGIKENVLWIAIIYICSITLNLLENFIWNNDIQFKVSNLIKKDMCKNILEIKNETFDSNQTGTFTGRIIGDADIIIERLEIIVARSTSFLASAGVFIAAFIINWKIGLIYLAQVIILVTIFKKREDTFLPLRKEKRNSGDRLRSILTEMIRGIRDIKNLNVKNEYLNKVKTKVDEDDKKSIAISVSRGFFNSITTLFRLISYVLLFWVGVIDIKAGILTPAELITLYLYAGRCMNAASAITEIQKNINDLSLSMNRAFGFENENEFPKDHFGTRNLDDVKGDISFKEVSFGYNDKERVLNKISFDIKNKTSVAFVGESGAGKTTLLSLLTKNYTLDGHGQGHIYIDDIDINELSEKSFRSIISYIPQMPYIFNMSIKDNLLLVKENATEEELDDVLKKSCLYDYVESLPNKKDTIIGEGGINLSGGQRQRLAIARSLLKDCKILLLDEATSALDNITQKEIKDVINNLSNKYTIITIAHRLSTIKEADKIFVLDDGRITAEGTHNQLLNNPIYSRLYAADVK